MKSTNAAAVGVAALAVVLTLGAWSNNATEQAAPSSASASVSAPVRGHVHNNLDAMFAHHSVAPTDGNVTCAERNITCGGGSSFSPTVTASPAPTALPGNIVTGGV